MPEDNFLLKDNKYTVYNLLMSTIKITLIYKKKELLQNEKIYYGP